MELQQLLLLIIDMTEIPISTLFTTLEGHNCTFSVKTA